jgi:hypothetical protein
MQTADIHPVHPQLGSPSLGTPTLIHVADPDLYSRVLSFRETVYAECYPAIKSAGVPDILDFASHYFTSLNHNGEVTSCSRLVLDSDCGLPSEVFLNRHIAPYRLRGAHLAELGRMAVRDSGSRIALAHFAQAFDLCRRLNVHYMVFVAPLKKRDFFTKFLGAELLCDDINEDFGSHKTFAIYIWDQSKPNSRLLKKFRIPAGGDL